MTSNSFFLRCIDGVQFHPAAYERDLDVLEREHSFVYPDEHRKFLMLTNGAEAYAGYVRVFGIGGQDAIPTETWNHPDCWKFAWSERCLDFWCFAETAWGDQYAYRIDEMNGQDAPVYCLDAIEMQPTKIATTFAEFLDAEFYRLAVDPYDEMLKAARDKFGPLNVTNHLIHLPPLLLGGEDKIENVQIMPGRSAMICNGDIAIQLDDALPNAQIQSVVPWQDERGRMRLRITWI